MLNHNLKLKRSFPLLLDAYYISYLSAKNKKSYFPIVEGILIGTLSNFIGLFYGQFSSQTYVFKKKNYSSFTARSLVMFKEKVVKIILALTFLVMEYKESSRRFTMSIIFLL